MVIGGCPTTINMGFHKLIYIVSPPLVYICVLCVVFLSSITLFINYRSKKCDEVCVVCLDCICERCLLRLDMSWRPSSTWWVDLIRAKVYFTSVVK